MATKLYLRKLPGGMLVPDNDEGVEWLQGIKAGDVISADVAKPRNYKFLKKCHALVRIAFDHFTEHLGGIDYKGMKAEPSYTRFRKDMTILAGFYTATYDINGNVKLEAMSWSFANCSEEEMQKIFNSLINVALKKIFKEQITEDHLRQLVDQIMSFA